MDSKYKIIILGGGPAGQSAACSIVRQDHKTVLFGSGEYRNSESKYLHIIPICNRQDPKTIRDADVRDLKCYGPVTIEKTKVDTIKQRDDGIFELWGDGKSWTGKKVVLATEVEDLHPSIF
jgi:thioredoxin reductase